MRKHLFFVITRFGILLIALGLVASSCGGDTANTTLSTTTSAPTPTTDTSTTSVPLNTTTTETAAAAGDTDNTTDTDNTATDTNDTNIAATDTNEPDTPATTSTAPSPAAGPWEQVAGGEDCKCADGSDYNYWVRPADPEKVVFYLEGGGACFSADTCAFDSGTYSVTTDESDNPTGAGGIFDFSNPENPLANSSFVAAPYCTGDVHIGNNTQNYSDTLTVYHNGFANASAALAELRERFPDAKEIVVAGSSAGAVAAPLFGGLVGDLYPDAKISAIADAAGAYPSNPLINSTIGNLWGSFSILPDWPVNADLVAEDWGVPEMIIQSGRHNPHIRFARFDNAFDATQLTFAALAGFDATNMDELIKENERKIEAAGVPVSNYLAPGTDHTILGRNEMYALEVSELPFIDWITTFLSTDNTDTDVACVECGK